MCIAKYITTEPGTLLAVSCHLDVGMVKPKAMQHAKCQLIIYRDAPPWLLMSGIQPSQALEYHRGYFRRLLNALSLIFVRVVAL